MNFQFVLLLIVFLSLIFKFMLSIFNKDKIAHNFTVEKIKIEIDLEEKIYRNQKEQLQNLQRISKISESAVLKVVDNFKENSNVEHIFVAKHLENLGLISESSLELIKIYNRFVKAV